MTRILLLIAAGLCGQASAQAPSIDRLDPSAILLGRGGSVTLVGDNLDGAARLWTSFEAITEPASSPGSAENDRGKIRFNCALPKRAAPGLGAIRVISPKGISPWKLVVIDPYRTVEENKTNNASTTPHRLSLPLAVDGRCDELKSDYYVIRGRKGERLHIDVVARRSGSALDPFIRLVGPDGKDVASSDDAPGLQGDSAIACKLAHTGDHLLEIRDTQFRGGKSHDYRLRASREPLAPLPFLANALPASNQATPPGLREAEPNNDPASAQRIQAPARLEGRFHQPGDRDLFKFDVKKGERLIFSGRTRSIGSPCDLFLQLLTTNGTKIATANLTAGNEGTLTNTFKDAGTFLLLVEELNRNGDEGLFYRIDIEPLGPRFALSVELESIQIPPAGSVEINVTAGRSDYDGEIALESPGLPPGFKLENHVIKAKAKETKLKIIAPPEARPGEWFQAQIVGHGTAADAQLSATASTLPALRKLWPELAYPPLELDGWLAVGIREPTKK